MIEQALRERLEPVVDRQRRLRRWRAMAICWFLAALGGLGLFAIHSLTGWGSPIAVGLLIFAAAAALGVAWFLPHRSEPDYGAMARRIERNHPDLRDLLAAAVEQRPREPDGRYGYLQERVIREAVRHAREHEWVHAVSPISMGLTAAAQFIALGLFLITLSLLVGPWFMVSGEGRSGTGGGYRVSVSPGDTTVERGAGLVVLARFDGGLPAEASLMVGPSPDDLRSIPLTRNLDDPVFGGTLRSVDDNLIYHIEYAGRRTETYSITTFDHPELQSADARIVPPAYTELPEEVIKDTRRVGVLEGSRLTLTFHLNKPVAEARLVAEDGSEVDLAADPERPNAYAVSFEPAEGRRYELRLVDRDGRANRVPRRFVVDVHENLPPDLRLVFPRRDTRVSPLEELAVEAEVSDDFGVTAAGIRYVLAGSEPKDVRLTGGAGAAPEQRMEYLLAMEELGAEPDQLLTYTFWAEDVGPDGEPRRVSSDMYFAEVAPFEEIFREGQAPPPGQGQQQQQQGAGAELAELQKQIINATWNLQRRPRPSSSPSADDRADADVIRQSQDEALQMAREAEAQVEDAEARSALRSAMQHMETALNHLTGATDGPSLAPLVSALSAERSAYQALLRMRAREHQVARSSSRSQGGGGSSRSQQQLDQLELEREDRRYESARQASAPRQSDEQREDLQVLNRLRELARRQDDLSERLKELQVALQEARTSEEKEELERQLERLREEQREMLRDVDELRQRMDQPENRRRMAEERRRLDEIRSHVQEASEAMERGEVAEAVPSTTRAQRELEEMRDEFRRRTSSEFAERMRGMRDDARRMAENQEDLAERMTERAESDRRTLAGPGDGEALSEQIDRQREAMEDLTERMRVVTEESEESEPLLSQTLYDTLREAETGRLDETLELTGDLLRNNLMPQAREAERRARVGVEEVKEGVERAAERVLGDEEESLRMARAELDDLIEQVGREAARAGGADPRQAETPGEGQPQQPRPGEENGSRSSSSTQPQAAEEESDERRGGQGGSGERSQPAQGESPEDEPASRPSRERGEDSPSDPAAPESEGESGGDSQQPGQGESESQQPGSSSGGSEPGSSEEGQPRGGRSQGGPRTAEGGPSGGGESGGNFFDRFRTGGGGSDENPGGPLTGENFRDWSDRLRDVEEMLSDRAMRGEVAQARDRARSVRAEFKRHGTEPRWDLVQSEIIEPLVELRQRVGEELARRESDRAPIPIDRDPVPSRYTELVRRYYEQLGTGE